MSPTPRRFSLRRRLTIVVAGVVGLSLAVFSFFLDAAFRRALREEFDARLAQDASAVASMVEDHGEVGWEFESGPLLGFEPGERPAYFQAWTDEGAVIGRSPSLEGRDLPLDEIPTGLSGGSLPDDRAGRWLRVELPPRRDPGVEVAFGGRRLTAVIARGTEEITSATTRLRWLLWISALTAMALASLAGALAVRQGLGPLVRLGARVDGIDARRLDDRLPTEGLPEELLPPVSKLNELLARLEESFERERRFGTDASHELRTPLAGLRSILEVARSRERPAADYREAIDQALEVTRQLGALVESLLALAHVDRARGEPSVSVSETIALSAFVDDCYAPLARRALDRGLHFLNEVPPGARVESRREALRIVLQNLLENAVDYTDERGTVAVRSEIDRGLLLEVKDSGPPIPEHALEKIFERFYRLDASRTATGEHWGIGLALARAVGRTLDLSLTVENRPDGWVAFELRTSGERPAFEKEAELATVASSAPS